jgi:hypothetical protein
MSQLLEKDHNRLVKLLGLTGSDHDGERANAAQLANRLVTGLGMTWADVIARPAASVAPARSAATRWTGNDANPWKRRHCEHEVDLRKQHQLLARALLQTGHDWSEWERGFLTNMITRKSPSPKEAAKLTELRAAFWGESR